jgi:hypothetical protein
LLDARSWSAMAALSMSSAAAFGIMTPTKVSGQATSTRSRSTSPGSAHSESEASVDSQNPLQDAPMIPRCYPMEVATTSMHVEGDAFFHYAAADSIATAIGLPWRKDSFAPTGLLDLQLQTIDAPCHSALFTPDPELGSLQSLQQAVELGSDECPTNDLMGHRLRTCRLLKGSKAKECTNGASCVFCVKKRHLKEKRPVVCRTFVAKGSCTNGAACLGC